MVSTLTPPERAAMLYKSDVREVASVIAPYLHGTRYQLGQPKYQIGDFVSLINPEQSDPLD